jgi:small-conductance mechanosensitive channel|tara:strand:+ start:326 stop:673 length:348 start_codon:yes stop_codon:yes gene_type:complete
MRVRISYGVELDEVPAELRDLTIRSIVKLKESIKILEKNIETMTESNDDSSCLNLVNSKIDSARQGLANSDAILADVQSILGGLADYYAGEEDVREGRLSVDTTRNGAASEVHRE